MAADAIASAIASAVSPYVQQATAASQGVAVSDAVQEATETQAVTLKEAASGDMQAVRLLAKEQAAKAATAPKNFSRTTVDHLA